MVHNNTIGNRMMRVSIAILTQIAVLGSMIQGVPGQQVKINDGAYFKSAAAYTVLNGPSFSNNGKVTFTDGTLIFTGTSAQLIEGSGPTILNSLKIENPAGVTLTNSAVTQVLGTLSINSGTKFIVAPGIQLSATGTITNSAGNAGFVLQSDATGTASLLHNSADVPATVHRYISGSAEAWHFLSSPVAAQEMSGSWLPSGTYGNGTGYDLYLWNEPNNCWIYKLNTTAVINWNTVHPGAGFAIGRGYLYSVQAANPTKEFAGNLNNGMVSYGLTASSDSVEMKGFNLVGNPYPSSVDWSAGTGWTRTVLTAAGGGYDMWIWNPAANNYGVYNSSSGTGTNSVTRYIAPMQGFFVRAANAGNLSMDNTVRAHDGAGAWKNEKIPPDQVRVSVESEADKNFDEVCVLFGYDPNQPGSPKLFSPVITAPSIYMPVGKEYFSIRYLTDTVDYPGIPVMFKPGRDGNYILTCDFDSDRFEVVILEDRQANRVQNLKVEKYYGFQALLGDDPNRFVLHFGPFTGSQNTELSARIFTDGSRLIVDLSLIGRETEILVCDILGRTLLRRKLQGGTRNALYIKSATGILVVSLNNPDGVMCRKLVWNSARL